MRAPIQLRREPRRRGRWRATGLALSLLISACDLPTASPIFTSKLAVPVEDDSVGVGEFIPPSVQVRNGQFQIVSDTVRSLTTLGDLCIPCRPFHQTVVPVPMATWNVTLQSDLPADVAYVVLDAGSSATFEISNGLGFDPLRPAAQQYGTLIIVVRAGPLGDTLAVDRVDGTATALPPGGRLRRTLPLPQGRQVVNPVELLLRVDVPQGDPVVIDTSETLAITVAPVTIVATEAGVVIDGKTVRSAAASVSFTDAGNDVVQRVEEAEVQLTISNPLLVTGQFDITFDSSGSPVTAAQRVDVVPGFQNRSIRLEVDEVRRLLRARNVSARVDGVVSGEAANRVVTLRPRDVIQIGTAVILSIRVGD